jgi:serine/threonine-protein kinase
LSLDEGRAQKVAVYFGREDAEGEELVVIYSECGPADPKYYEVVLRKNLSIPSGAFAVRDLDGSPHFVLVDTMLASSATPSALAKKIEHIADRADAVEQSLTKQDTR